MASWVVARRSLLVDVPVWLRGLSLVVLRSSLHFLTPSSCRCAGLVLWAVAHRSLFFDVQIWLRLRRSLFVSTLLDLLFGVGVPVWFREPSLVALVCEYTVNIQCPHSALTVPAQCPHSARTVPSCKSLCKNEIGRRGHPGEGQLDLT